MESIGAYTLDELIGEGGMGRVYRARHMVPAVARRMGEVVIKVMHSHIASVPELRARLRQEAAICAMLDHPGVVPFHDLVMDGDRLGLVIAYVPGRGLDEFVDQITDRAEILHLLGQVAGVLDYLHRHDPVVVHRDLKPSNVRVRPDGSVVLIDFGIAREGISNLTRTGTGMGSLPYMAPEQYLDAKNIDARTDIYALGMLAYRMATGDFPWDGELSEYRILKKKESGNLDLSRLGGASDAIRQVLSPNPADRFRRASAFVAALGSAWGIGADRVAAANPSPQRSEPAAPPSTGSRPRRETPTDPGTPFTPSNPSTPPPGRLPRSMPTQGMPPEQEARSKRGCVRAVLGCGLVSAGGLAMAALILPLVAHQLGLFGPDAADQREAMAPAEPVKPPATMDDLRASLNGPPLMWTTAQPVPREGLAGETPEGQGETVSALVAELYPELPFAIQQVLILEPGLGEKAIHEALSQAQAGSLVFFRPGRYVLKDSLHFAYKQDLFLLGLDRPEIFVSSGKAVVHLEHVQRARLEGLYMNHHRAAVSFYAEVASECGAFMLDPRLHDSTVLELDGGSGISVVNSELEGSGFIGIRAENTRKLRLIDSIIHDTVSYAIELTASDARLQNTLLYDVGRSSFHTYDNSYDDGPCRYGPRKSVYVHWLISGQWTQVRHGWTNEANKCLVGGYSDWGWTVPPQPVKVFNTAVRVTDGSTLEIEKSTVHVPQPFPSSHFAEVGAQSSIQVSKSLISAGTRDSKLISDGTLSITDSCLQVSTSDPGNVAGWKPNFLSPPEGVTFDSALTLGDVCIKRGAKLANGRIRPTKKP